MDNDELAACRQYAHHLSSLSGERIAAEMRKLLTASDITPVLQAMEEVDIWPHIALITPDLSHMRQMLLLEEALECDPGFIRRLACLCDKRNVANAVAKRWKLSRKEAEQLRALLSGEHLPDDDAAIKAWYRKLDKDDAFDQLLVYAAQQGWGVDHPQFAATQHIIAEWQVPLFPVTGADIKAAGIAEGKEIGRWLSYLEQYWEARDYTLSKEQLLSLLQTHTLPK